MRFKVGGDGFRGSGAWFCTFQDIRCSGLVCCGEMIMQIRFISFLE